MTTSVRFEFVFGGSSALDADAQIWVQGYEDRKPDNPTPADVVAFIKEDYSSLAHWMDEWNMGSCLSVEVFIEGDPSSREELRW